jgi:hypothetical protein
MDPMILMENDGYRFRNTTFAAGLPFTGKSHGVVLGDLFGDGRLSILVGAGGAYPADLLTMGVYYPKTLPGNYVNIRLNGVRSNRSAIGAKISLVAGGRKQYREVSGGTNFGCMPFEQHFGLADIGEIDALEIRWPSGLTQRFGKTGDQQHLPIYRRRGRLEGSVRKGGGPGLVFLNPRCEHFGASLHQGLMHAGMLRGHLQIHKVVEALSLVHARAS